MTILFSIFILVSILFIVCSFTHFSNKLVSKNISKRLSAIARDEQGYEIKSKEWFNGLSVDPGASLTDPRAVPEECRKFSEEIKAGKEFTFKETISLIDKHYDYFEVPFTCGDLSSKANENVGSAKIFSFGLMTRMSVNETLRLFGEIYKDVLANPQGTDHANIRNFMKYGWARVSFNTGLAIVSKLQAYDDTDSAFATQSSIEGKQGWDVDSDSWIP